LAFGLCLGVGCGKVKDSGICQYLRIVMVTRGKGFCQLVNFSSFLGIRWKFLLCGGLINYREEGPGPWAWTWTWAVGLKI